MSTVSSNPNLVQTPYLKSLNLYLPVTLTLTSPHEGSNGPHIDGLNFFRFLPICGILSKEWVQKEFVVLSSESSDEEGISKTDVI